MGSSVSTASRFDKFRSNLSLTEAQKAAGRQSRESVVRAMNNYCLGLNDATKNSIFVGSWAKYTRIRPPRDVDVLYILSSEVRLRFDKRTGNKQSQLLQDVRQCLLAAFPNTAIRGDGPVVLVPFTAYNVELVPAFINSYAGFDIPITTGGGSYKRVDYIAEADQIAASDAATNGNTRELVRMMKCWQRYCSVQLKSYYIELLAIGFLQTWEYREKSSVYYDYMVRDFLAYLVARKDSYLYSPGTYERMALGSLWLSKAETAQLRAKKACDNETMNEVVAAEVWRKVFGSDYPSS